jgi:hypothetical protein
MSTYDRDHDNALADTLNSGHTSKSMKLNAKHGRIRQLKEQHKQAASPQPAPQPVAQTTDRESARQSFVWYLTAMGILFVLLVSPNDTPI